MNINLRPKKCSGQSRYGRYGSYATVIGLLECYSNWRKGAFSATLLTSFIHQLYWWFQWFQLNFCSPWKLGASSIQLSIGCHRYGFNDGLNNLSKWWLSWMKPKRVINTIIEAFPYMCGCQPCALHAYMYIAWLYESFFAVYKLMSVPNYGSEVYGEGSICVEVNSTLGDCLPLGGTPRCYQRRVVQQRTTNQIAFAINVQGM